MLMNTSVLGYVPLEREQCPNSTIEISRKDKDKVDKRDKGDKGSLMMMVSFFIFRGHV